MSKTKIILASTGGVALLVVTAAAMFAYVKYSEKVGAFEGDETGRGLSSSVADLLSYQRKQPFPSQVNVEQLKANARALENWRENVRKDIASGDWSPDNCTPAQFKEGIVLDTRQLLNLTSLDGLAGQRIFKPDFGFGPFKDFLGEKMPSTDQLPRLQRQWHDISSLFEILYTNGVLQVTDLQVLAQPKAEEPKPAPRKNLKKRKSAAAEEEELPPSIETYKVEFTASPKAFVDIVRKLSFQRRFTVVDSFTLVREHDAITAALGEVHEKKKGSGEDASASPRRNRRRSRDKEAEKKPAEETPSKKDVIVFDPAKDAIFKIELTVSVYDFRTLEARSEKGGSK